MNTGVTITTIVLTSLIIIPLISLQLQKRKHTNKILNTLRTIADQQNSNITAYEVNGDYAIGVDQNRKQLFFYREKEEGNILKNIDLNTIKKCEVINSKSNNSKSHVIDSVGLNFVSNTKMQQDSMIELYNHKESYQLNGELDFVKKWSKTIQDIL